MNFDVAKSWNPRQARLREIILKPECFDEAVRLALELHAIVHASAVYGGDAPTWTDGIRAGLTGAAFRTMPTDKDVTVAWNLWHISRIEDLTVNILIAGGSQVLDAGWAQRLNTAVRDTGNAMTDPEIISFSNEVDMDALFEYRAAVGARTKGILQCLCPEDMKRTVPKARLDRLLAEGGLTEHPDSIWLRDFWGRKTVAGLILMPVTRHQVGHLNDCGRLKKRMEKAVKKDISQ